MYDSIELSIATQDMIIHIIVRGEGDNDIQ